MKRISLNGNWQETNAALLSDALTLWDYGDGKYAVAVNGEFVARNRYEEIQLQDGDTVDVVAPVGGG